MSDRMIDKENIIEPEAAAPVTPPPVEEAPISVPTDSDSDGDGGEEVTTIPRLNLGKIAHDINEQLDGVIDTDRLKAAAKAPGNRALGEWMDMGIAGIKGAFEGALGKRDK